MLYICIIVLENKVNMNIAVVQAHLEWEDVPENLKRFEERIERIVGAEMIVLPEMFTSGFTMKGKEQIAPFYREVCQHMLDWACRKGALIMGSTIYSEEGFYYNRLLAAFPDGKLLHYDKRHCFTMAGEDKHFASGSEGLVFEYRGVKIAPFICYDLRFPVWSRNTCHYDLAVYVANWPEVRKTSWQILLKARAVENQCYVVGVNRVGTDGIGLRYSGNSVLLSPKGEEVLACVPFEDEVRQAEMDMDALREFRAKFPVLQDRDEFTIQF